MRFVTDEKSEKEYKEFLERHERCNFQQSPEWAKVKSNWKNEVVLAEDENGKIIGAVSVSIYKNKSFIESLAVDKEYRSKGHGKLLLDRAIKELKRPVYTISKTDKFYLKNGFVYDNNDLIDEECKNCDKYNVTCFPKVVVYN